MPAKGLEIDDDPAFQRRLWAWQRRSWALIAAVLAFAAVGGFGKGPLSNAEARDEEGRLHVSYERFGRMESPTEVEIAAAPGTDGRLRLRLGEDFLRAYDVEGLDPYRASTRLDPDGATFTFDAVGGAAPVVLTLEIRPKAPGLARIQLGVEGGPMLSLAQFVYP
ncbi:hypothetical protein [Paludisphaera soli]|uniref:hypothetical protein n=1 Tax=Paludisphaera soli TaxID=2712865 RepID=UPI0013EB6D4C|nr:hypothetical protein [Paludisphaera soli]